MPAVCILHVQNVYRIMVRPCLGKQVFAKIARPAFEAHKKKDAVALAAFNKAIKGVTFDCKVSTWTPPDGGDTLITAFALQ
jgi:hypothetical protein